MARQSKSKNNNLNEETLFPETLGAAALEGVSEAITRGIPGNAREISGKIPSKRKLKKGPSNPLPVCGFVPMKPDNFIRFLDAGVIYPLCYEESENFRENRPVDCFDKVPDYIPVFPVICGDKDECVIEIGLEEEAAAAMSEASNGYLLISTPVPVSRIRGIHFSGAAARKKFQAIVAGTNSIIHPEWYKSGNRKWGTAGNITCEPLPESVFHLNKDRLREYNQVLGMVAYVRHGRLLHYLTNKDKTQRYIPFISPEAFALIAFLTGEDFYIKSPWDEFLHLKSGVTDKTFRALKGATDGYVTETNNLHKSFLYNNLLAFLNELVESGTEQWNADSLLKDWVIRLTQKSADQNYPFPEKMQLLELAGKAGDVSIGLLSMDELLSSPVFESSPNFAPVRLLFLLSCYRQRSASYTAKEAFRNALFFSESKHFSVNEKQLALLVAGKYFGYRVLPLSEPVKPAAFNEIIPPLYMKLNYSDPLEMYFIEQVHQSIFTGNSQSSTGITAAQDIQNEKEVRNGNYILQLQFLKTSIGKIYRLAFQEEVIPEKDYLSAYPNDISNTLLGKYTKVHLPVVTATLEKPGIGIKEKLSAVLRENDPGIPPEQIILIKHIIELEQKSFRKNND